MAQLGTQSLAIAWPVLVQHGATTLVTYTSVPTPTVNVTTGLLTSTPTPYSVQMLLAAYQRREVDDVHIMDGDQKALIPKAQFVPTPTLRDTITRDGLVWSVVQILESGNGSLWVFQIRRPGVP